MKINIEVSKTKCCAANQSVSFTYVWAMKSEGRTNSDRVHVFGTL